MEIDGWEVVYAWDWWLPELWHLSCSPYDGLDRTVDLKEEQWFCQKCNAKAPQSILGLMTLARLMFYSPQHSLEFDFEQDHSNLPDWIRLVDE